MYYVLCISGAGSERSRSTAQAIVPTLYALRQSPLGADIVKSVRLMEGSVFIVVSSQVDVLALDLPTHVIQTTRSLFCLETRKHDLFRSIVSYVKLSFEQRRTTLTHQD